MIDPEIVSLVSIIISAITATYVIIEKCLPKDPKKCRSQCCSTSELDVE
jgi:hypothetical protein